MEIFGYKFFEKAKKESTMPTAQPKSLSYQDDIVYGHIYPIVNKKWDGEKTLGELGTIVRSIPDYQRLRVRSYDAYTKIDTVKIIASKFFYWTIGSGLKLQSEPNRVVLKSEGISNTDETFTEFQKIVEARFQVWANSKQSDFLKEKNLHELALDFYQGAFLGGDNLAVVRFDKTGPNIQFISGEFIENPTLDNDHYENATKDGNFIQQGVEIDITGKHIAYYVRTRQVDKPDTYERIPAVGTKSGKRLAWLISGKKISPDHLRAVPAMSQSLEKINKLDRYVEAAVNKAEQGAKVVYAIEHEEFSTGESPIEKIVKQRRGELVTPIFEEGQDRVLADGLANQITQTTNGQAFNMTQGSKLKSFESSIETDFAGFHGTVFNSISAGVDVPPEVAMQQYNSNYSASRAAINSFGYIISVNRQDFANKFYIPIYKLWLEHQILTKKISAKGYIENQDNLMVTESYTQCRFMGKNMPHIDPLKEIKAVREMLGVDGATPLISREQASEILGTGEWSENFMKSLEEEKLIPVQEVIVDNSLNNKTNENKVNTNK
jgi:capsid protein